MTSKADKLPLETEPVARDNNTILTLKPVDQTLSRLTQLIIVVSPDLDKLQFFYLLKTFKFAAILVHPPFTPVFPWLATSCDMDSGTFDIRLDSSQLFYCCKFNSVAHTKRQKGVFCMDHKAKFTEVKQKR